MSRYTSAVTKEPARCCAIYPVYCIYASLDAQHDKLWPSLVDHWQQLQRLICHCKIFISPSFDQSSSPSCKECLGRVCNAVAHLYAFITYLVGVLYNTHVLFCTVCCINSVQVWYDVPSSCDLAVVVADADRRRLFIRDVSQLIILIQSVLSLTRRPAYSVSAVTWCGREDIVISHSSRHRAASAQD